MNKPTTGARARRRRTKEEYHFPAYASAAPGGVESRFIQLGVSLLEHENYVNLSAGAKVLYAYMKKKADPSPEFEFPHREYSKFTDSKAFHRACKELEQAGFIKVTVRNQCARKPNRYRFSADWKRA